MTPDDTRMTPDPGGNLRGMILRCKRVDRPQARRFGPEHCAASFSKRWPRRIEVGSIQRQKGCPMVRMTNGWVWRLASRCAGSRTAFPPDQVRGPDSWEGG